MAVNIINDFVDNKYIDEIIAGSDVFLEEVGSDRPGYFEDNYPKIAIPEKDHDGNYDKRVKTDLHKRTDILIQDCLFRVKTTLENFYKKSLLNYEGSLVKLTAGAHNGLHSDMYMLDGSKWHDGTGREDEKEYSALLYFSDYNKDFFGGEVEFPQHNLVIKPKRGDLVFFRGDLNHLHEVKPILGGNRYAMIMFFGEARQ